MDETKFQSGVDKWKVYQKVKTSKTGVKWFELRKK